MPVTSRVFLATGLALAMSPGAAFATPARLIDARWLTFGRRTDPDQGKWDAVLRNYASMGRDRIVRVENRSVVSPVLRAYLAEMGAIDPTSLTQNAAFAYWANVYNALTVEIVHKAFPVASIRDIGGSLLARGPWRTKVFEVAGQSLSLDDIEHGILRPIWRDARVHYAVNCASIGCPNLAMGDY